MSSNLSEKQEVLLCRLFDGDLGFFDRYRARRLLQANCDARDFLTSLESISSAVSTPSMSEPTSDVSKTMTCDLWDKIEQRIDSEERAALFLGNRAEPVPPLVHTHDKGWYSLFSTQALLGGLSGAATTALVLLVVSSFRTPTPLQTASSSSGTLTNESFVTQASLSNGFENSYSPFGGVNQSSGGARPLIVAGNSSNSVMEVDWMRGDGPLRVIQNPSERSTIIWVNRQNTPRRSVNRNNQRQLRSSTLTPSIVLTQAPVEMKSFSNSPR